MCIIGIARNAHPLFPLIVASNRDEFFSRPTTPLERWGGRAGIIAGRDLDAGGTWLGVNANGRFAAITNYRDPTERVASARSRGEIVVNALASEKSGEDFLATLRRTRNVYRGFNFIWIDAEHAWIYESRFDRQIVIADGITVVSNGPVDSAWPKCIRLGASMKSALSEKDPSPALFNALEDATCATLAHTLPMTGVSPEIERALSSVFVRGLDGYGTRSSCVLMKHVSLAASSLRETTHAVSAQRVAASVHKILLE